MWTLIVDWDLSVTQTNPDKYETNNIYIKSSCYTKSTDILINKKRYEHKTQNFNHIN